MTDEKIKNDAESGPYSKVKLYKGSEETEISIDKLRKTMIDFIQVENLNLLIGAGCSSYVNSEDIECAIPTMNILSKEFYESNKDDEIFKKEILGDKIFNSDAVKNNLEALMNRLISIEIAFESERNNIEQMKLAVNEFIFNKISIAPNQDLLKIYKELYMRLERSTRKTPINVYTTNYDLYNENALDELKTPYNNGFLGSARRLFNPNSYNYILVEDLNLSNDSWKNVSNFTNLYKIHGSINWIKENNNIVEKDIESAKNNPNLMLIYPTPYKDRSTLQIPYSDLFRMMQNNLLKTNSVLITIGYSFSDEHINRVILNALSSSNFRLVIFGMSEHIDEIIKSNNKRIWVVNSENKIHYFENVVKYVLPQLSDDLQKKRDDQESLLKLSRMLVETTKNA